MPKPHTPLRVLIVDDESLVATLIQDEIEILGHTVIGRAPDGRQAVQMTIALRPDVVLMDIAMPEVDGLDATRQIQEQCPCPVVLLTAHDDPELVKRAELAGAGAYLVKPPHGPELARTLGLAVARFRDLMELRRVNEELRAALAEVKVLRGMLPICASCKRIRDEKGGWHEVESYIAARSRATFTHSFCDDCGQRLFPADWPQARGK